MVKGILSTPLGNLHYLICGGMLQYLSFKDRGGGCSTPTQNDRIVEKNLVEKMRLYFSEGLWDFQDIPLNLSGMPEVYVRIYTTLCGIPPGKVITYSELAERTGIIGGARVVGQAMAKNPFVIVIPCHRVVGKNSIGGFSAGLERKVALLNLEGVDSRVWKKPPH